MESPLSFNSSENFRKKLLVRNLPPYKVENAFSTDAKPASVELSINDLTPIDSPSVEQIGNQQEQLLFPINQYGPENTTKEYGNVVPINNNLNYKTNEGEYGYPDTIQSDLEIIGNETEKQIIIKNVYRPENGVSDFGSTAWYINNDKVINTIGEGEYTVQDTVGSGLEVTGQNDRPILITNNQYGPQNLPTTEVSINNNLQTNANEGEYGYPDTINSPLENEGDNDRPVLIATNQYGPENLPTTQVSINNNLQTNANEGEYGFPDTVDSELQIVGEDVRKPNFLQNPWGPEQGQSETEVEPYRKQKNLVIPQGNYLDETDTYGNELEFKAGVKETEAYLSNRYATGDGEYDPSDFGTFQQNALQLPYANSDSTFIFLPSTYTPYSILLNENPSGSDGSLSQDSSIAIIGAKTLNKEFKHRVAYELYQQTLGQVNIFNSNINPDTGEVTVKPNTDPFDALGLVTGNIPILSRVYNITTPDFLFGQGINFAAKLAGLYSPYSYIPGEYFDYPDPIGNGPYENALSLIGGAVGALFSVLQPANQSSSELLVEYTSVPTRKLLYDQLRYNIYRPDYKIGTNLTAPPGAFYIGERKNQINSLLSPSDQLPLGRDGKTSSVGPVLSYSNVGKLFETSQLDNTFFGINSRNFSSAGASFNGTTLVSAPISGDLTWMSKANDGENYTMPGKLPERGGADLTDVGTLSDFARSNSANYIFTPGSILDVTQKLVDAGTRAAKSSRLEHVGNAINQISKVFNDGYQELTKGSRVIKYTTKNSQNNSSAVAKGLEYCRVFTKDRPYYTFNELQKSDGNIRKYTNSVLDNTYNLNIVPTSNNIQTINGTQSVKKYMFSLENLAWRTSNKKGFTYNDLPACEKGPNGGRIMWFPPYDLSFDESISTSWQDNNFLGRTEPIYTYTNTSRKGNVSFKIVVDHPSIMNLLVKEELKDSNNNEVTQIIDSFFAGCTKYDLWDLTSKFPMFTPNDIFESQILTSEDIFTVVGENSYTTIEQEIVIDDNIIITESEDDCIVYEYNVGVLTDLTYTNCDGESITLSALAPTTVGQICIKKSTTPVFSVVDTTNIYTPTTKTCKPQGGGETPTDEGKSKDIPLKQKYPSLNFFFDNNYPTGVQTNITTVDDDKNFKYWYNLYIAQKDKYLNTGLPGKYDKAVDYIMAYGDNQRKDVTNYVLNDLGPNPNNKYLSSFIDARKSSVESFFEFIETNYSTVNNFYKDIGKLLDEGYTVSFDVEGGASALSDPDYNQNLSERRIDSVLKWIYEQVTPQGTKFEKFKNNGLIIKTIAKGEIGEIGNEDYQWIDCSKGYAPNGKKKEGIVSVNAMACRRTLITNLDAVKNQSQTENPESTPNDSQNNQEKSGQDFVVTGEVTETNPNNPTNTGQGNISIDPRVNQTPDGVPYNNTPITRDQNVQTQTLEKRKDLTKRLARKLLTECNYFEYMEQSNPMVYDGLKSKLKYFNPAFHSITPEGLNSRLVFLQQCMRPGDTIPTVSQTDGGQEQLLYNDVSNSAFGAPPICVLRIGDFFHTKIAIDQISLKYEDGRFDLNPEGIGIQPMIADVSISFSFIGAHGLANPIAKLQNALSFNYYANTEMYDERAESTEDLDLETYDSAIIEQAKEQIGVVNTSAERPLVNNGGVTIGKTVTNVLDTDTAITTGFITYGDVMKEFAEAFKDYATTTSSTLEKINEEFLFGGVQIFTTDRKFVDGNFNYLNGDTTQTAKIFGFPEKIQTNIKDLATKTKNDIDNGTCPLLAGLFNEIMPDVQIRKIKRQLKSEIDTKCDLMLGSMSTYLRQIAKSEENLVSLIDKIAYVSSGHDGFIKKLSVEVYNLSGTTAVGPNSAGSSNTLQELITDSYVIKTQMNELYTQMENNSLIPIGDDDYSPNYTQNMYLGNDYTNDFDKRFFMVFGKTIIDDSIGFVNNLIDKALPNINSEDRGNWLTFLNNSVNNIDTGLKGAYLVSKDEIDGRFNNFKNSYFNNTFNTFNPYDLSTERRMWYESQEPPQAPNDENLTNLYMNGNSSGDKFNLKKKFK